MPYQVEIQLEEWVCEYCHLFHNLSKREVETHENGCDKNPVNNDNEEDNNKPLYLTVHKNIAERYIEDMIDHCNKSIEKNNK